MNGESQVLQADVVIFPMKLDEIKVSEGERVEVKEIETIETAEVRTVSSEGRFARLKKSLRKRSASIL